MKSGKFPMVNLIERKSSLQEPLFICVHSSALNKDQLHVQNLSLETRKLLKEEVVYIDSRDN